MVIVHAFSREDVEPLLEGLAILGTGGGGAPSWGKAILEHDLDMGRIPTTISLEDIDDDATVVSGGIMGSVKVLESMGVERVVEHWEQCFELEEVMHVMQGTLGREIDHVVPFELGGLNTPIILSLAARMGIPAIDGDGVGRAAPETQMASFIGHGISLTPMPLVDLEGNVVLVQEATTPTYPDELGRWVITRGGGLGANAHYPMTGRQAKQAVIPNSISQALGLGRAVIQARKNRDDPVAAIVGTLQGFLLFEGSVSRLVEEQSMGFYHTLTYLDGTGEYRGRSGELVIKNETMLLSLDGQTRAVFPDLICMLDPDSGRGIMTVELTEGANLALVGLPCHPRLRRALRSEVGSVAFSPARYGYPELEYVPIERLVEPTQKRA